MKNQKRKKRKAVDEEPDFLGMALSKTRKRKTNNVPTLFKEDIGDAGIKTKRVNSHAGSSFDIRLTKEEKRRRKERQVCGAVICTELNLCVLLQTQPFSS
jgi:hypothetical protein